MHNSGQPVLNEGVVREDICADDHHFPHSWRDVMLWWIISNLWLTNKLSAAVKHSAFPHFFVGRKLSKWNGCERHPFEHNQYSSKIFLLSLLTFSSENSLHWMGEKSCCAMNKWEQFATFCQVLWGSLVMHIWTAALETTATRHWGWTTNNQRAEIFFTEDKTHFRRIYCGSSRTLYIP